MSQLQLVAIYDNKAQAYMPPSAQQTNEAAIRSWSDACNNPETMFNKHPDDYALYNVGTFSESSGEITPSKKPEFLVKASSLIQQLQSAA